MDVEGRPLTQVGIRDGLSALCREAGVPYGQSVQGGITPHSFRHWFKTVCISTGIPPVVYNRWMDHSSQPSPEDKRRGASAMDATYYDRHADPRDYMAEIDFPFPTKEPVAGKPADKPAAGRRPSPRPEGPGPRAGPKAPADKAAPAPTDPAHQADRRDASTPSTTTSVNLLSLEAAQA
ncbi:MAG: hypothetical protein ACFCVE_14230 [Phycisphaerae bacterium]